MPAEPYRFRLYIVGGHVGSARAEPDLRQVLDACLPEAYELEVIDLNARPDLAQADRIIAAPTVIRLSPEPVRRALGSMRSIPAVAAALGLTPPAA
jgi:circadian clock protein KaiB